MAKVCLRRCACVCRVDLVRALIHPTACEKQSCASDPISAIPAASPSLRGREGIPSPRDAGYVTGTYLSSKKEDGRITNNRAGGVLSFTIRSSKKYAVPVSVITCIRYGKLKVKTEQARPVSAHARGVYSGGETRGAHTQGFPHSPLHLDPPRATSHVRRRDELRYNFCSRLRRLSPQLSPPDVL